MSSTRVKRLTAEERAQLRASMSYPDGSVGALMDFELITIRDDVTLEVVLRYLRRFDELPDHTDQIFVVDRHEALQGALPLDRLLLNEPETEVRSVMKTDVLTLSPLDASVRPRRPSSATTWSRRRWSMPAGAWSDA
jgi:magnesium transporter